MALVPEDYAILDQYLEKRLSPSWKPDDNDFYEIIGPLVKKHGLEGMGEIHKYVMPKLLQHYRNYPVDQK